MVSAAVLGYRGYLGSVVARRWAELGVEMVHPDKADVVVLAVRPDNLLLAEALAAQGPLVVPSTDAIAEDTDYARTKRILERTPGAVIIRAGIVDIRPERQPSIAYRNWSLNPLTPLEWADAAFLLRDRPGLHTLGREPVSRFQVTDTVARIWDYPAPVPSWAEVPLSRVQESRAQYPPLAEALTEFREWYGPAPLPTITLSKSAVDAIRNVY
jgi:hypothetical protein